MTTWSNVNKSIDGLLTKQDTGLLLTQAGDGISIFSAVGWTSQGKPVNSFYLNIDSTNQLLIDTTNKLSIQDIVGTSWNNITKS